MNGAFKVPVSAARGESIKAEAGDAVHVSISLDSPPVEANIPLDLVDGLATNQEAADFFDGLTASQQKSYVTSIEDAKTSATRARRVAEVLDALMAGLTRP